MEFPFETFRPEKQNYLFRCPFAPGNFPLEQPKKSCSIYFPTRFSGKFFFLTLIHQTQSLSFFGTSRPSWEISTTVMEKSVGTVVQFERFLTRAKLYPRAATLYVPTPYHHPTDSVETVKAQFLWSFNIVLGEEGEGIWICKKTALLLAFFLRHNLWNA